MKYVALLRGINVGGKNKVSMAELRLVFEEAGCLEVRTYINSGNVLFQSNQKPPEIVKKIEKILPSKFSLDSEMIKVLIISEAGLQSVISQAPTGFGTQSEKYHSDAIFLMGISVSEAMPVFSPRDGVDKIWEGKGVVYSQRLSVERVKSRLSKIVGTKP